MFADRRKHLKNKRLPLLQRSQADIYWTVSNYPSHPLCLYNICIQSSKRRKTAYLAVDLFQLGWEYFI